MAISFDYLRGGRQVSLRNRNRLWIGVTLAAWAALPGCAQYPVQTSKPDPTAGQMRAVAVLEWTGEEGHPKASRLVPVTVYDGQNLQDASVYLARPAPFALMNEVEYELKENGRTTGLYVVNGAGQEQGSWVGFGAWKPVSKPKPAVEAAKVQKVDSWGDDDQSDRPVLHRKAKSGSGSDSDSGPKAPADPDRPTLHKKSSSESGGDAGASGSDPAQDPDRPTLHKKTAESDSAGSGSTSASDPDRPTLKKKGAKTVEDTAYVESMQTAGDPDRPHLLRGIPANEGAKVLPTLMGLPPDMQQVVAVSDAKNRPEHLWSFSWASPEDEGKMKAQMEDLARKALGLAPPVVASAPVQKPVSATRRKTKPPEPPLAPAALLDEKFRVFELAYGSGATMVLSAHTDGIGAKQKFVTLVAQPDLYGNMLVLQQNVTDAAHLDDTPHMRLVDAVDALADNRGELLFELRGTTQRQFALYRVLRGQIDRVFVSSPGSVGLSPSGQ